ncbi:mitochondrial inner membrane protease subunit 2 [Citrus sinensis]|nr:mitochondrial inner membrane protease subunit 2 [Citrus sinensis]
MRKGICICILGEISIMAAQNFLWSFTKNCFTFGLIGLTISDRYASIVPVQGSSMSPTFNLTTDSFMGSLSDDYVLVEKFCLQKYKFSHGDVIVFCSPSNHKEKHVKRIIGLPGDWIGTPMTNDVMKVPNGHCWVEGDNPSSSLDSRSFGPIPLGLIKGWVTHILWPPQRVRHIEQKNHENILSPS